MKLATAALLLVFAAAAGAASPTEIRKDFDVDGKLLACLYSGEELTAAKAQAGDDAAYTSALDAELSRDCSGSAASKSTDKLYGVRITKIHAAGHADKEYLQLRNLGGRTRKIKEGSPSTYQLRMSNGPTEVYSFDDVRMAIKAGQTVTLRFGCAKGARKPKQVGATVKMCLDRGRGRAELAAGEIFADRGAVVELWDSLSTGRLSRLGYGSRRGAKSF